MNNIQGVSKVSIHFTEGKQWLKNQGNVKFCTYLNVFLQEIYLIDILFSDEATFFV